MTYRYHDPAQALESLTFYGASKEIAQLKAYAQGFIFIFQMDK